MTNTPDIAREEITEQLCQHLQQLGVEVFNIERNSDHYVIWLTDYGHHLCLYFHGSKHNLYFAPMDPAKILDPTKLADAIRTEFEYELHVTVTPFAKSVVERRLATADILRSKLQADDWPHSAQYVETAKKLKAVLDFSAPVSETDTMTTAEMEAEIAKKNLLQQLFDMAPKLTIFSGYRTKP